jgi:hypothetical protein
MSLKAFHIFFVVASILCAAGFGAWAVDAYRRSGGAANLGMAVGAFAAAAVLLVYGRWFLKKLKDVSYL